MWYFTARLISASPAWKVCFFIIASVRFYAFGEEVGALLRTGDTAPFGAWVTHLEQGSRARHAGRYFAPALLGGAQVRSRDPDRPPGAGHRPRTRTSDASHRFDRLAWSESTQDE